MDDQVWCGLDLQLPANDDVAGLHRAADDDASFWPSLADYTASFLAGDDSMDIIAAGGSATDSSKVAGDMALDMDQQATCFVPDGEQQRDLLMMHRRSEQTYDSSSYSSLSSSKRSLSIDSAGTTSSPAFSMALDATAATCFSSAATGPHDDPFAGDDDAAIMRAMMAVLSSASPSSSESSSPQRYNCRESGGSTPQQQAAAVYPRGGNDGNTGHVTVRSTSLAAVAPEMKTAAASLRTNNSAGGGRQQQETGNSSQVYHMMSERKRREKLNDSFQTLRSLLPPCSKKDKTTVLINAASYLRKLEAEVSELEEKNGKLERHVPREAGGTAAVATTAHHHRRAKVQLSRAASDAEDQVNLTVMVMVECDIVDLVLHVLERLRWMAGVSVLSVDADTYSPQVLLKAIASIKLQITDGERWNEASFHEAMKKVVHDATASSPSCANAAPLVAAA